MRSLPCTVTVVASSPFQVKFFTELGIYVCPLMLPYFYKRLEGLRHNPRPLADFAFGVSCFYVLGLVLRAYGRFNNPTYKEFAEVLRKARENFSTDAKVRKKKSGPSSTPRHSDDQRRLSAFQEALSRYDFEFWAWPVEFNPNR